MLNHLPPAFAGEASADLLLKSLRGSLLSRGQRQRAHARQAANSVNSIADHPLWSEGLGLADHTGALKAGFINVAAPEPLIKERFSRLFACGEPVRTDDNPQRQLTCHMRCNGLCLRDPLQAHAASMARQLHEGVSSWRQSSCTDDSVLLIELAEVRDGGAPASSSIVPAIASDFMFLCATSHAPSLMQVVVRTSLAATESAGGACRKVLTLRDEYGLFGKASVTSTTQVFHSLLSTRGAPLTCAASILSFALVDGPWAFAEAQVGGALSAFGICGGPPLAGSGADKKATCPAGPTADAAPWAPFGIALPSARPPGRTQRRRQGAKVAAQKPRKRCIADDSDDGRSSSAGSGGSKGSTGRCSNSSVSSSAQPPSKRARSAPAEQRGRQASAQAAGGPMEQAVDDTADDFPLALSAQASRELETASSAMAQSTFFNRTMGIVGADFARTGRSTCFLCSQPIPREALRLEYAFARGKVARWIHPSCGARIDPAVRSQAHLTQDLRELAARVAPSDVSLGQALRTAAAQLLPS